MTNMAPGILYGVGVGPGDPDLMTVRAARILAKAPVVAFFRKKGRPGHARRIVAECLCAEALEEPLDYPVTTEIPVSDPGYNGALAPFYAESADRLLAHLKAGRDVALLSEGDPLFYGSFMHLFERLKGHARIEIIAGITAMSGAWAAAGVPITWGDDILSVLPATLDEEVLATRLAGTDAAVIMKLGRHLPKVKRALQRAGCLDRALYVERGTMPEQHIEPLKARDDALEAPYFSLILVPGRGRRP